MKALLLVAAALIAPATAIADSGPRIAIVVGNDTAAGRTPLRFASADARRVQGLLESIGQVGRTHLLIDGDARALDDVLARVERDLQGSNGSGTVIFYYSGHADDRALLMADSRYRFRDLRARLAALPAKLFVAVLDACQSGAATRAKGAEAVPVVDLQVYDPTDAFKGGVFLTSSAAGELSHESDQLEASFFTHYLLAGLRGAADASGDGRVSLEEAYRYAYQATVSRTQGSLHGTQHPTVDVDIAGRGQVILTWLSQRLAYLVLPEPMTGSVLVCAQRRDGFIQEIDKPEGRPVRLALAAGDYEVSVVKDGLRWSQAVSLEAPGTTVLDPKAMRAAPLAVYASKGGEPKSTDVLQVGYLLRRGFLLDAGPSQGVRATYLRSLGWLEVGLGIAYAQSSYLRSDAVDVDLSQIGVALVSDLRRPVTDWLVLFGGADAGVDWLVQQGDLGGGIAQTRTAVVFPLALRAGFEFPIVHRLSATLLGRAGIVLFKQQDRLRAPLDAGLVAGLRLSL